MITSSPEVASHALISGVDNIFVDLEINGKIERQGHLNTVISKHSIEDVSKVGRVVTSDRLLVRINPINFNSANEINMVIEAGAGSIMLPMFRSAEDVSTFVGLVNGRARCCLLLETVDALKSALQWIDQEGIDQVHIGLNDLHIELGSNFMFEPLVNGLLDNLCMGLRDRGIPFGIGGIARLGEGLLPAEFVLAEHVRLGSSWVILSRTFHRKFDDVDGIQGHTTFAHELGLLRSLYKDYLKASQYALEDLHQKTKTIVDQIVVGIRR